RSRNTTSPIAARSVVPKRSSSEARTSSSSAISLWTISSLDATAAPRRPNAFSAALLPAAVPPVIAALRGLLAGRGFPFRRSLPLGCRLRLRLGLRLRRRLRLLDLRLGLGGRLRFCFDFRLGLHLGDAALDDLRRIERLGLGLRLGGAGLREDFFRE